MITKACSVICLIDNYDSFTFNLVHYLGELGAEVRVHRNDKITAARSSPPIRRPSCFRPGLALRKRPASASI